jgi:hypothetical protein
VDDRFDDLAVNSSLIQFRQPVGPEAQAREMMMTSDSGEGSRKIDPSDIAAWITLASTAVGLLTGFANQTESIYSPIDTVFVFLAMAAYGGALLLVSAVGLWFVAIAFVPAGKYKESRDVQVGLLVVLMLALGVLLVPAVYHNALAAVKTQITSPGGIEGIRLVAVFLIAAAAFAAYRLRQRRGHPSPPA